jgi:hypothetical protein
MAVSFGVLRATDTPGVAVMHERHLVRRSERHGDLYVALRDAYHKGEMSAFEVSVQDQHGNVIGWEWPQRFDTGTVEENERAARAAANTAWTQYRTWAIKREGQ